MANGIPLMAAPAPAAAPVPTALVKNYARQEIRFVRGSGCWLEDDRGNRYLDCFAGVAVCALGHAHPAVVATLCRQVATLVHVSNHYQIPEQETLAAQLSASAGFGKLLFCNSGTEANEAAYKAVRLWGNITHGGRKTRIIAFTGAFHGRTLGSLSITHNAKYREPFAPLPPAEFLPFGDLAALSAITNDVAGVFIEPIQGEGGVFTAPDGFLAAVRAACDRAGALLVVDEIQTGAGRTGKPWCWQHSGARPDIMTVAKGLGGGVPIGAALFSDQVADLIKPGLHGTTFGGNPLACAVASTVVERVFAPAFLTQVTQVGEYLRRGLAAAFPGRQIRGQGLLLGVQLDRDPGELVKAARDEGLIVGPSGANTLRLAPPLIVSENEAAEAVSRLTRAARRCGI
ncbi:acetylornithine aminotransferase [Planctomycetota bacterium]|nr:acetylornithine aminotransferase [Planctomycetota bacterium]